MEVVFRVHYMFIFIRQEGSTYVSKKYTKVNIDTRIQTHTQAPIYSNTLVHQGREEFFDVLQRLFGLQ